MVAINCCIHKVAIDYCTETRMQRCVSIHYVQVCKFNLIEVHVTTSRVMGMAALWGARMAA